MRKVFGIPHAYQAIVEGLYSLIERSVNLKTVAYIGGDETAGIPLAAWLASKTNKGLIYTRKRQKEYGLRKVVEGADPTGKDVVLGRPQFDIIQQRAHHGSVHGRNTRCSHRREMVLLLQRISPNCGFPLRIVDMSHASPEERKAKGERFLDEEGQRAFDLTRGPLTRSALVRLGE
jgi:hypothetical protein